MKIRTFAAAGAAVSLAVAPAMAADRAVAPVDNESEMGNASSLVIGVLAAAAIIAAILIAVGDEENPVSV